MYKTQNGTRYTLSQIPQPEFFSEFLKIGREEKFPPFEKINKIFEKFPPDGLIGGDRKYVNKCRSSNPNPKISV